METRCGCKFTPYKIDWVLSAFVSKEGRFFWTGSTDKTIGVYDLALKTKIHQYENLHTGIIKKIMFGLLSPD